MRIIADSSCDLYTLDVPDFRTVPLTVYTDERSFTDDTDLNIKDMLDYLASYKGRSYTSCPSVDAWLNAFEGADEIFVSTVTSALSGSYNSAMTASTIYQEENPGVKISVIDSLSTGAEEALLLFRLKELIRDGEPFEVIDRKIRAYLKKSRLFFSFFSLHNLSQNGRVSKAAAAALCVLNISVTGTASEVGKISVTGKARGERKSIRTLFQDMKNAGYNGGRAVITHVENESMAASLKQAVLAEYPQAEIIILPARGLCSYYMERRGVVIACETQ
ncbi:MAG: DegV family protein [Erysipelotrichaceae bacterium]|jgi:DegV family protein with EDD domain|nr:DegV family protein [Erysipelotrichaceae bacterium]MDO5110304.1 DegV family protein [Erysipelotrichaceae bacterium]